MNTKYPINGRYTTLADIIHEYGRYSDWPSYINNDDNQTYYWSRNDKQPFIDLIFNSGESDNGIIPYEIVWFDDVYSNTEKNVSTNSKIMKIIQAGDSAKFSAGREIRAEEIVDNTFLKTYGIPFRFIIGQKDSTSDDRYYFNYKTLNGESTVMYALREIIKGFNNLNKSKLFLFGFGKNISDYSYISDQVKQELLNASIINEDKIPEFQDKTDEYIRNIYVSLFTYDVFNKFDDKGFDITTYNYDKGYNVNNPGIFEDTSQLIISKYAYVNLGENIWTKYHVQYNNYSTDAKPNINTNLYIDTNETNLLNAIYYVETGKYYNEKDNDNYNYGSKKYIASDNNIYKIYYYTLIFLQAQRFYYSFVTSIKFSRISTISYAKSQPVLRCDLGLFQTIKSFRIISAEHDPTTALPAYPFTSDTTIRINIKYQVEYNEIPRIYDENYSLNISFKTISDWTLLEQNNPDVNQWIRVYNPDQQIHTDPTSKDGDSYTTENTSNPTPHFYHIWDKKTDDLTIFTNYSDGSLGTIKWPFNSPTSLRLNNANELQSAINNKGRYENSYDISTYIDNNNINYYDDIDNTISPLGALRLHTVFDSATLDNIMNSSYYIDIPIYRCFNYYYIDNLTDNDEAKELLLTYNEPIYKSSVNQFKHNYMPKYQINVVKVNKQIGDTKDKNISWLNEKFSGKYFYTSFQQKFYLYLKKSEGIFEIYASGATKLQDGSPAHNITYNDNITENDITIYTYDGNNIWSTINTKIIEYINDNNNTESLFEITLGSNADNYLQSILYFKLQINGINNNYYFKNGNYKPNNISLENIFITHLKVLDYAQGSRTNRDNIALNQNGALRVNILLYNKNKNYNKTQYISIQEDTSTTGITVYSPNLYLRIISFKIDGITGGWPYNYTNFKNDDDLGKPKCYFAIPNNNSYTLYNENNAFEYELEITNLSTNNYYISVEPIYIIEKSNNSLPLTINIIHNDYSFNGNRLVFSLSNSPNINISDIKFNNTPLTNLTNSEYTFKFNNIQIDLSNDKQLELKNNVVNKISLIKNS